MGPENVDSIRLAMVMRKGDMVGDSVIPLGLEVFRLTKPSPHPASPLAHRSTLITTHRRQ